jgi:hypothetical protein
METDCGFIDWESTRRAFNDLIECGETAEARSYITGIVSAHPSSVQCHQFAYVGYLTMGDQRNALVHCCIVLSLSNIDSTPLLYALSVACSQYGEDWSAKVFDLFRLERRGEGLDDEALYADGVNFMKTLMGAPNSNQG